MRAGCVIGGFCIFALGAAPSVSAQVTPASPPTLEIHERMGGLYWVVESSPDGSRRGGWVSAEVPLDRIDRDALQPIPALAASSAAPPVNERAVAANPGASAVGIAQVPAAMDPLAQGQVANSRGVGTGTVEFMALGSLGGVSVAGKRSAAVTLNTFLGVFATPKAEVGVSTNVVKMPDLNTSGSVMGLFLYNFPIHTALVPFVGTGLGMAFGNADTVGHPLTMDLSGGVRVMMPGTGGWLVLRPFYQRANVSSEFVDVNLNTWGVAIGASLPFRTQPRRVERRR